MYVCKRVALNFIRATLFSSNFAWRLLIAIFTKISKESSLEGEDWRQIHGKQTELFAAGGGRLTTNPQKANRVVHLILKGDSTVQSCSPSQPQHTTSWQAPSPRMVSLFDRAWRRRRGDRRSRKGMLTVLGGIDGTCTRRSQQSVDLKWGAVAPPSALCCRARKGHQERSTTYWGLCGADSSTLAMS